MPHPVDINEVRLSIIERELRETKAELRSYVTAFLNQCTDEEFTELYYLMKPTISEIMKAKGEPGLT